MLGTITSLPLGQTTGKLRNDDDGSVYPFDRGSNYTVNFDMLHVGMKVSFSVVTFRDATSAQNLRLT